MDVAEGFLFVVLLVDTGMILAGTAVLAAVSALLRRIGRWQVRLGVMVLGMALNFLYSARLDISWVFTTALLLAVPMAVLVPVFGRSNAVCAGVQRMLVVYLCVAVVTAALPFVFVASGVSMVPFLYWHTVFSNAVLYGAFLIGAISLAAGLYRIVPGESVPRENQIP
jgi:hypothetical protein